MELRGVDEKGNLVSAPVTDMAEKLRQPQEQMVYGSSPTHVTYTSRLTGENRVVDLQEVAQAAGMRNVQFHFDPKQAKESGLLQDRDIDDGVAYNLERIKTDKLREQYLSDKGYKNVYWSGDDAYSMENGKMYPINNKEGLDVSDLVRLGAHAGRDIGTALAVGGAIGGSSVAALPTGGTSMVAAAALAGTAGAAGAGVGETVQRGFDKVTGADADKYNKQLTGTEEAASMGKDMATGAVSGMAQPVMTAGLAKLGEGAVAPMLEKSPLAKEWMATQAAKIKGNAALSRLPQKLGARFGSEEEAAAQDAINEGMQMLKDKSITPETANQITKEAAIRSGAAKPSADASIEAANQAQLRGQYQSATLEAARQQATEKVSKQEAAEMAKQQLASEMAKQQGAAQDAFAGSKKELETLFDEHSDLQASLAAQRNIVGKAAKAFVKPLKLGLDSDPVTGEVMGIEGGSLDKFVNNQTEAIFSDSKGYLNSARSAPTFLEKAPPDSIKGQAVKAIRSAVNDVDSSLYDGNLQKSVRDLIPAITDHTAHDTSSISEAVERFHAIAIDMAGRPDVSAKTRNAISSVTNILQRYEVGATSTPDLAQAYYAGFNKLMEVKTIIGQNRGVQTDKVLQNVVLGLDQLARTTGDHEALSVRPMVHALHMDDVLSGRAVDNAPYREMLTPDARKHMDAMLFVKNYASPGKEVESADMPMMKKLGSAAAAGMVTKLMGGSSFEAIAAMSLAYKGGAVLPTKLGSGLKAIAGGLKGAGSAALSSTTKAAAKAASSSYTRTYASTEEASKLLKFKSGEGSAE